MTEASATVEEGISKPSLITIACLFLRLGATAFGGPAAHIAMMQDEVVRRKRWLTEQEFLDLISAANLIPGPNSTEIAIHIGHRQAGLPGLIVAGLCFILPAAIMVTAIAWFYVAYAKLPAVAHIMTGIKPVVVAIVFQVLIKLSQTALKTNFLKIACVLALAACAFSMNEILILVITGSASLFWALRSQQRQLAAKTVVAICFSVAVVAAIFWLSRTGTSLEHPADFTLTRLFLYFVKVGSVLYGSGYVLLAFLRTDLVEHWHWLSSSQLLDATAIGQITPGPVFTTATFIGYLLAGPKGAAVATGGIFLPAFVFVGVTAPFLAKLRQSTTARSFLDGVNVASLALMAYVTFQLGRDAFAGPIAIAEFCLSMFVLQRWQINPTWLIGAGALLGFIILK